MMKAIIFDMDGVLIDSEHIQEFAEKETCRRYSIPINDADWENFKGRTSLDIFTTIVNKYHLNITPENLKREKNHISLKLYEEAKLFDGALETLQVLRHHYKIALTTSNAKRNQEKVFSAHNLDALFDIVVTSDMVINSKPHPEPYLKTIDLLCLNPKECIVVEDSDNGILSARQAGAHVIGITHTFPRERLNLAHRIVDNFEELLKYIHSI